ncbi:hypothetical protein [Pseudomonas sp. P1.8]|uniref:hypothetical protein n=1 Tax=Pseudomonas sp. P1.8 TaxID=1699310 RepID=UPI00069FB061|nr:hypothetical protein [Pseudomonas sp. P1.8]
MAIVKGTDMKLSVRGRRSALFFAVLIVTLLVINTLYGVRVDAKLRGQDAGPKCPLGHPIELHVSNFTLKRLAGVIVQVEGWRNGNSTNILSGHNLSFTRVLAPFESGSACYSDSAFQPEKRIKPAAPVVVVNAVIAARMDRISTLGKRFSNPSITTKEKLDAIDEIEKLMSLNSGRIRAVKEEEPVALNWMEQLNDFKIRSAGVVLVVTNFEAKFR